MININKTEIISTLNGFHGRTTGALALTGQPGKQEPFSSILPAVKYINYNSIENLKAAVNEKTCAIFLEAIQGEGGIIELDIEFVKELHALRDKYNFLIIMDEIQAGLGRTGTLIACYCMKHFNFPADAFIGWIRIARPGSVLGPQQQFLNDIQDEMFKRGIEYRKKFNISDDLVLKLENLKLSPDKEKTKMSEDDKKKAKYGEEGQGNYLTQNKKQHKGN